jgi:hypothetical protein
MPWFKDLQDLSRVRVDPLRTKERKKKDLTALSNMRRSNGSVL